MSSSREGELETEVIQAVRKLREASAREVLEEMTRKRPLAYTTVATVLDRLYHKGLLVRNRVRGEHGFSYVYKFAPDSGLRKRVVNSTLRRLLDTFGSSIIPAIYQRLETVSSQEREELRRKIRKKGESNADT